MSTPCGYQQITLDATTPVGLTVPTPDGSGGASQRPVRCIVTPEVQAVRWRDFGNVAVTAAVGYPLAVGSELRYDANLPAIRFIGQVTGAILNVTYYY